MRWIAAALVMLGAFAPAAAQDDAKDYPNRTIRIVVPFPAGGPADLAARIIAQKMSEDWGQPVDRKSTRLNSSHVSESRMPSSA